MEEVWKDIIEFPNYEVSSLGHVRNKYTKHILRVRHKKGYNYVHLCRTEVMGEHIIKHRKISRLVATAFIPNPENKLYVDHINRVRGDDRVENLRWATYEENMANRVFDVV